MEEIARVMFGVGGLIVNAKTRKILVLKRSSTHSDFNQEKWELLFGRKNEHEGIVDALHREAKEEIGIENLVVGSALRIWHFYRGPNSAANEIIGITFVCETETNEPILSAEHSEFRWVGPDEALELINVPGIREDISLYKAGKAASEIWVSEMNASLQRYPAD
ncbi:NUDIX domain-containing protein [Phaeobacter marinintestinus]|uniref:NUDIX domain-containing protein n=1 Tax=Falsiphaeobacter marinintestinus TaxID=1492905 RepID=UPI0016479643|nr:NUDIX domain-containing protein [Phaeobacter marinintestinus]